MLISGFAIKGSGLSFLIQQSGLIYHQQLCIPKSTLDFPFDLQNKVYFTLKNHRL
tara:strand:- start:13 stop:177 length:165 start_codon:yes stop_codon:yes gene_type:complete